jgi:large subunit ribosomal protein L31
MKPNIHPIYHPRTLVHCACGEVFYTRSTQKEIRVEICSKCHPFFTGKQKLVDSAGRVERFQKRFEAGKAAADKKAAGTAKPAKSAPAKGAAAGA